MIMIIVIITITIIIIIIIIIPILLIKIKIIIIIIIIKVGEDVAVERVVVVNRVSSNTSEVERSRGMEVRIAGHNCFNQLPLFELAQYCCLVCLQSAHRIYQGHRCEKLK